MQRNCRVSNHKKSVLYPFLRFICIGSLLEIWQEKTRYRQQVKEFFIYVQTYLLRCALSSTDVPASLRPVHNVQLRLQFLYHN